MKATILCNGEKPPKGLLAKQLKGSELFIACDGAAQVAMGFGKTPDIIIGDLDSLSPELLKHPHVRHVADQNSNDLQKALDLCLGMGIEQAVILGASGRRFDHFLANLYALPRFAPHMALRLVDVYGEAWIAPRCQSIEAAPKTPLSLFALGEHPVTGLTLEGLAYGLFEAILEPNSCRASLNFMAKDQALIQHQSGVLLIYLAHQSLADRCFKTKS